MVILTFVLAVTNIVLGLWLAIRLGFGPPTLTDAWDAFTCFEPSIVDDADFLAATDLANHLDDLLDDDPDEDDFDLECLIAEEEEHDREIELDYEVSDMLDPTDPEYWDLSEKFVETSILKLVIAAIKNGVRTTSIDTELRNANENADRALIQSSRDSLLEDCQVYLEEQKLAGEDLKSRLNTLTDQIVAQEVSDSLEHQTRQLEATMARLNAIDFEVDPKVGAECLLDELNQLRVTRHRLLDIHNRLFLEIARSEGHLDAVDSNMLQDHLTRLYNRIGIEVTLSDWFARKRHKTRQLSVAIFDIHEFTEINNKLGILIGDKILVHLAKYIRETCGADDLIGRLTGQQILVVYCDIGPQAATKNAEIFRQTIKESTFLINEESCSIELNFAFTEIKETDSEVPVIINRLLEALRESKKAGPDKSFMHDGSWVNPIESPPLRTKPKTFRI